MRDVSTRRTGLSRMENVGFTVQGGKFLIYCYSHHLRHTLYRSIESTLLILKVCARVCLSVCTIPGEILRDYYCKIAQLRKTPEHARSRPDTVPHIPMLFYDAPIKIDSPPACGVNNNLTPPHDPAVRAPEAPVLTGSAADDVT